MGRNSKSAFLWSILIIRRMRSSALLFNRLVKSLLQLIYLLQYMKSRETFWIFHIFFSAMDWFFFISSALVIVWDIWYGVVCFTIILSSTKDRSISWLRSISNWILNLFLLIIFLLFLGLNLENLVFFFINDRIFFRLAYLAR